MKKKYVLFQIKQCIDIIKHNLVCILLSIMILTVAYAAVNFLIEKNFNATPIKVGVVYNEEEEYLKMILRYLSKENTIKSISSFEYLDYELALKKLKSQEINMVIDVPKDYYNDINNGINTPLNIYVGDEANILTMAFVRVLYSAQAYIQNSEATVYAVLDIAKSGEYEIKLKGKHIGDYVALIYGDLIIHRLELFDDIYVSAIGKLSFFDFIFLSILVIVILYNVTMFGNLYDKNNMSIENIIKPFGIPVFLQSLYKQFCICGVLFIEGSLLAFIFYCSSKRFGITTSLNGYFVFSLLILLIGIVSIYNMMMYVLDSEFNREIIIILFFVINIVTSGLIVPYSFMPEYVMYVGKLMPLTYLYNIMVSNYNNCFDLTSIIVSLLFVVVENILVIKCSKC